MTTIDEWLRVIEGGRQARQRAEGGAIAIPATMVATGELEEL